MSPKTGWPEDSGSPRAPSTSEQQAATRRQGTGPSLGTVSCDLVAKEEASFSYNPSVAMEIIAACTGFQIPDHSCTNLRKSNRQPLQGSGAAWLLQGVCWWWHICNSRCWSPLTLLCNHSALWSCSASWHSWHCRSLTRQAGCRYVLSPATDSPYTHTHTHTSSIPTRRHDLYAREWKR